MLNYKCTLTKEQLRYNINYCLNKILHATLHELDVEGAIIEACKSIETLLNGCEVKDNGSKVE